MLKNPKIEFALGILCGLAIVVLVGFVIQRIFFSPKAETPNPTPSASVPSSAPKNNAYIAKIGDEYLYKSDLDTEFASYPNVANVDVKNQLLEKMTRDSVILQAAQKEGLISLNDKVYNSASKNYLARIQLVAKVQEDFKKNQSTIKGSIVAIYFFTTKNSIVPYETRKEQALAKIQPIYNN